MATASNVSTGKAKVGGAVYVAPKGTSLPTDASTALASDYKGLGYVSEDGLTTTKTLNSGKIKAWGGDSVLNYQEGVEYAAKFKLLEALNLDVLKTVYGASNITGTTLATGIEIDVTADEPTEYVWVFEIVMRGGIAKRIVIPCASITELGDIVYKDNEAVGYDITLGAVVTSGSFSIEYIKS